MFAAKISSKRKMRLVIALSAVIAGTAAASPLLSDAQTRTVQAALSHAAEEGLDPGAYRIPDLPDPAARNAAASAALLDYMRDVRTGRPALKALDSDMALPPPAFDAAAALDQAVSDNNLDALLAGLAPSAPGYASLKLWLAHYRRIAAAGGWPLTAPGAESGLLLSRLAFEDNITGLSDAEALKRFQARHGLTQDGALGSSTLAALNVPAGARADTIAANMERWRWLPGQLEADRIVVNVADARLDLFLGDNQILTSRVIVGKPATPTPILRAEGAGVTVNPPWTVPASIAAHEILPKLKRNPAYLVSQDMFLLDGPPGDPQGLHVNWRAIPAGHFPYRLRQHPGPKNSLGRIKLELPNQFDVYLHDTPGRAAFNAAHRDVSHGCVRVEQILPLASYALAGDLSAVAKISDAVNGGETGYLPLARKLPVYFLYWTAFVDAGGTLQFRPDIYGRDQRMIRAGQSEMLAANPVKCSRG
jgi:murein L,D-transpeptidase YcbB/YkuD